MFYWAIRSWKVAIFFTSTDSENRSFWKQNLKVLEIKTLVFKSCCPGFIEQCRINHFYIFWETKAVEQFPRGMYWGKKRSKVFLVPFLATKEVLAPLANDPIMLGRPIRLFRHLYYLKFYMHSLWKQKKWENKWGGQGIFNI